MATQCLYIYDPVYPAKQPVNNSQLMFFFSFLFYPVGPANTSCQGYSNMNREVKSGQPDTFNLYLLSPQDLTVFVFHFLCSYLVLAFVIFIIFREALLAMDEYTNKHTHVDLYKH